MSPELVAVLAAVAAFAVSAALTWKVRAIALSRGILDVPNDRSSHSAPTPRGGGIAIVVTTTLALAVSASLRVLPADLFVALAGGGAMIAVIGFMDDRRQLSARLRLAVHCVAALWATAWLGGVPPLVVGGQILSFGAFGYVLGMLGIVWVLNLFNFMDGIDGIAASEAVFISWGGTVLALIVGTSPAVPVIALIFGAACCGFLLWNWPPARIFMGDVGSGYLGYLIAVLALAAARESTSGLISWLILGGVFFVDATVTLTRRIARGERVYQAHRTHAYQWLARRWASHGKVTWTIVAVNGLWLFPCALLATMYPQRMWWMLLTAFAPLVFAAIAAGAGRPEATAQRRQPTK